MDIKWGAQMDLDQEDISPVIHCENCRKQTGSGALGSHWICEDCRLAEQEPSEDSCLPPTEGLFAEQQHAAYAEKAR